jgi:hypothetical protein
MATLPNELLLHIFVDVGYPGLSHLCRSNRQFRQLCHDESLWRQLTTRDFPGTRLKPGSTWIQTYESTWRCRQKVHQLTQQLLRDHLLAEPRYARLDVMSTDITKLLTDFIAEFGPSKVYSHDNLIELTLKIFDILTGLKSEYIGSGDRGLDPRISDIDLDIQGAIENFLHHLGYMSKDDVVIMGLEASTEKVEPKNNESDDESGTNNTD